MAFVRSLREVVPRLELLGFTLDNVTADYLAAVAAIECYLDLVLDDYPPAKVLWTNYKRELESYHGAAP